MVCSTVELGWCYMAELVVLKQAGWCLCVYVFSFRDRNQMTSEMGVFCWGCSTLSQIAEESRSFPAYYFIRLPPDYSWRHRLSHSHTDKGSVNIHPQWWRRKWSGDYWRSLEPWRKRISFRNWKYCQYILKPKYCQYFLQWIF